MSIERTVITGLVNNLESLLAKSIADVIADVSAKKAPIVIVSGATLRQDSQVNLLELLAQIRS